MKIASYDVLGIPVSVTSLTVASEAIHRWARDQAGRFICVRDVHGVMQAQSDPRFMALHREAAMVTPDGMPLVWIAKHRKLPVARTCGPDLMDQVLRDSVTSGLRHYFYGGKHEIADKLAANFTVKYPNLVVVGTETPPFKILDDEDIASLAQRVRNSGADVVWIGLSTPKQEFLMQRLAPFVPATLIGVGAAFDFHAGAVRRAPEWMQRTGMEWLYRLLSEPRRLWRRYLIMAPKFVIAMVLYRLPR